jgi:amidohydrolase
MMASADWFSLRIEGKGGHGAEPHRGVDPVVIAAAVVTALQTLVSRETAPIAPVVLTLGTIRGGTAHNIIASEVTIEGTLRTFDAKLRQALLRRIGELAAGVAQAMRGAAGLSVQSGAPPVVNNDEIARLVDEVARQVVGSQGIIPFEPLMVGEDVAYFLEQRPGCFFLLGGAPDGPGVVHHTADFHLDERCLPVGLEVLTAAVLRLAEP